ncbi:MAG: hypothetical protein AMDU2_EPLC00005G0563 [Thermoplasmatales archaeon E-plasma]|nr:MAG: hypothetical protein AMDU2_EPLC00005G0563 [Thermoplasmatales archaeon E-plasma]
MDEDAITFGFLITAVAVFVTGIVWQGLFSTLFAMLMSGNMFYETMGIAGFILALIGALVLLYCALLLFIYIIILAVIFGIPAYLIYLVLGPEYSIILAVVIGIIALVYLIETRTVEVQHYTITLNPHRRYIIKR